MPQPAIPKILEKDIMEFTDDESSAVAEVFNRFAALIADPDLEHQPAPDSIARPAFSFFVLSTGICQPRSPGTLANGGWSLPYHEVMLTFDAVSTQLEVRPFLHVLNIYSFNHLFQILLIKAVEASGVEEHDLRNDFFGRRVPKALQAYEERSVRMSVNLSNASNIYQTMSSGGGHTGKMPPLPPANMGLDFAEYLTTLESWVKEMKKTSTKTMELLYSHSTARLRGELLSFQLIEPEVLQVVAMYEDLFATLFYVYFDHPLDEDDEDDNPYNDGHMSFKAFFRFCSDLELFPEVGSHHVIRNLYREAELTEPWFQPAKMGYSCDAEQLAYEDNDDSPCCLNLGWMSKGVEEMSGVEMQAMGILSALSAHSSDRLLRTQELFHAIDVEQKGFLNEAGLNRGLNILRSAATQHEGKYGDGGTANVIRLLTGNNDSEEEPKILINDLDRALRDFRKIQAQQEYMLNFMLKKKSNELPGATSRRSLGTGE